MHPATPAASVPATPSAAVPATAHAATVPAAPAMSERWGRNCERGRERTSERSRSEGVKESVVHWNLPLLNPDDVLSPDIGCEEAKIVRQLQMTKATDSDREVSLVLTWPNNAMTL
jgi:hypothetical protein